jgi:hypothetical protein
MRLPIALGICLALPLAAQTARVANAKLETRALSGSLAAELSRAASPAWVGYAAPAARKETSSCCYGEGWRGCGLEKDKPVTVSDTGPVMLEGSAQVAILFRMEGGKVDRVRTFALDCTLDAGGLPFLWLTGVRQADGISVLEGLARDPRAGKNHDGPLVALALQGGTDADAALIRLAREQQSGHERGQALFWLSQRAGQKAVGAITDAIDNDPDTDVKKKAVFALSQLPKDEGVPKLIDVAKSNRNPAVRKQAFFWLGQSNDERAFKFLEDILTR